MPKYEQKLYLSIYLIDNTFPFPYRGTALKKLEVVALLTGAGGSTLLLAPVVTKGGPFITTEPPHDTQNTHFSQCTTSTPIVLIFTNAIPDN